jgi:opacity protein-like surface antigen
LQLGHTSQISRAAGAFSYKDRKLISRIVARKSRQGNQEAEMISKLAIAGTALLLGSASSALAADLPAKAYSPLAPAVFNWTGYYLGAGGGFTAGTVTGTGTTGVNSTGTIDYVAVEGGYRYQLPFNLVLGFDVTAPVWASTAKVTPPPGLGTFDSAKPLFIVLPQVQIGYAFGQFLPYFGIGVGVADIKATTTTFAGTKLSDTEADPMLDVSFGLDYALTNNWILGVRYDHLQGEEHNYTFATAPTPTVQQLGSNSDGVTGMIKYKF